MTKIVYKNTKPKYMDQYINWPNVTGTFLKAGTPIAENGTVANNDAARGILANDVSKSDELQLCQLIIAGQLSLDAVESSFGSKLTTACKDALDNITFVQGIVWGIDSFDQWGVELGKAMAKDLTPAVAGDEAAIAKQDASTQSLIRYYLAERTV